MLIKMSISGSLLIIIFFIMHFFLQKYSWNLCKCLSYFPVFRLLFPVSIPCFFPVPQRAAGNIKPFIPSDFLLVLYLVIALSLFLYLSLKHIIFFAGYQNAVPADNAAINAWYNSKHKILPFSIKTSKKAVCPFVYGVFHPVIILPDITGMEDSHLEYLLEHEYTHIIHWDILQKYMLMVVLCLHWYNPLCWLFFIIVNQDMEFACDETVTANLNRFEKAAYAKLILSFSTSFPSNLYMCKSSDYKKLKQRVSEILKERPFHIYGHTLRHVKKGALTLMLFLFLFSCFTFTNQTIADKYEITSLSVRHKNNEADKKIHAPDVIGMEVESVKKLLEKEGFFLLSFK